MENPVKPLGEQLSITAVYATLVAASAGFTIAYLNHFHADLGIDLITASGVVVGAAMNFALSFGIWLYKKLNQKYKWDQ